MTIVGDNSLVNYSTQSIPYNHLQPLVYKGNFINLQPRVYDTTISIYITTISCVPLIIVTFRKMYVATISIHIYAVSAYTIIINRQSPALL